MTVHSTPHEFGLAQEEDHVATRPIVKTAIIGTVVAAVAVVVGGGLLALEIGRLRPDMRGAGELRRPDVVISNIEQTQVLDSERGLRLREAQERELQTWGWIDRDAGLAKIPIDQAIDIVAAGGGR